MLVLFHRWQNTRKAAEKEGRFILAHGFQGFRPCQLASVLGAIGEGDCHGGGRLWRIEDGSLVLARKQMAERRLAVGFLLLPFLFCLGSQLIEWCHPHRRRSFPFSCCPQGQQALERSHRHTLSVLRYLKDEAIILMPKSGESGYRSPKSTKIPRDQEDTEEKVRWP